MNNEFFPGFDLFNFFILNPVSFINFQEKMSPEKLWTPVGRFFKGPNFTK